MNAGYENERIFEHTQNSEFSFEFRDDTFEDVSDFACKNRF